MMFKKIRHKKDNCKNLVYITRGKNNGRRFVKVADTKDVQVSQMMVVEINGEKVCIANVEGRYYAIGNVCTHMGGPLAEGKIDGFEVQCPWHGSKFDIRTGNVVRPPAMRAESTYEVKVEDNNILIKDRER
jgi:glycine betaine catabolism B